MYCSCVYSVWIGYNLLYCHNVFIDTSELGRVYHGSENKKDERNFYTVNEGTHGTSGWMDKKHMQKTFLMGEADKVKGPILGKVDVGGYYEYLGLNSGNGLNKHIMTYGASGAGKSRGFVKPFILKNGTVKTKYDNS